MSDKRYYLRPFIHEPAPLFSVCVDTEISRGRIDLSYSIVGNIDQLRVPARSTSPQRKDGLWESMCFEFFVGEQSSKEYWEFNFSPSLDWQAYRFSSYREGRHEAEGVDLTLDRFESPTHLELRGGLKGLSIFEKPKRLEGSMTLVLESQSGAKTFWAVDHRGAQPDFHRRDSFVRLNRSLLFF